MISETPVPHELQREQEKFNAISQAKEGLTYLLNQKLEGGASKQEAAPAVALNAEEAKPLRQEIERIKNVQEIRQKFDSGGEITSEDKEKLVEVIEKWQEEQAAELRDEFAKMQEIDLNKLDELEDKKRELNEKLMQKTIEKTARGFRMDQEARELLKNVTETSNEMDKIRKQVDAHDKKIVELREKMENSQKVLDSIEKL